jgi:2-methoxy-6-polyprenyl-1,4-benzoquinol methylase
VESLAPFPGQRHLDVAGGTGDVAFRVYRAMRQAEKLRDDAVAMSSAASSSQTNTRGGGGYGAVERMDVGSVVICDINAAMLAEGERKAAAQGIGKFFLLNNLQCLDQKNNNS